MAKKHPSPKKTLRPLRYVIAGSCGHVRPGHADTTNPTAQPVIQFPPLLALTLGEHKRGNKVLPRKYLAVWFIAPKSRFFFSSGLVDGGDHGVTRGQKHLKCCPPIQGQGPGGTRGTRRHHPSPHHHELSEPPTPHACNPGHLLVAREDSIETTQHVGVLTWPCLDRRCGKLGAYGCLVKPASIGQRHGVSHVWCRQLSRTPPS